MKISIIISFIFLFTGISFGQSSDEIEQAIRIIEDISQTETRIGPMHTKITTKIIYSKQVGKVQQEILLDFVGKKDYSKISTTFYLEDIIPDSMIYDFYPMEGNTYWIDIRIGTKSNSVEITKESSSAPSYFPITETEYTDIIKLYGASRTMPEFLMKKYLEAVRVLIGADSYTKKDLKKADLEKNK
ncbi:MAG: hypothetical protein JJE55_02620 [Flavobacteriaceae bacterium]|nr:hypothetical protein [Flavobacteriaceae bacterium]